MSLGYIAQFFFFWFMFYNWILHLKVANFYPVIFNGCIGIIVVECKNIDSFYPNWISPNFFSSVLPRFRLFLIPFFTLFKFLLKEWKIWLPSLGFELLWMFVGIGAIVSLYYFLSTFFPRVFSLDKYLAS